MNHSTAFYAVKGGSGTTVITVASAFLAATPDVKPLIITIRDSDAFSVLGLPEPYPGEPVYGERVNIIMARTVAEAKEWMEQSDTPVFVDLGTLDPKEPGARESLAAAADRLLLVIRGDYLALRRAVAHELRPDGVIFVAEASRALGRDDVVACLNVPVMAEVQVDAAVARAVDAGILTSRIRSLCAPPFTGARLMFEYEIQGNYGQGWEAVTTEATLPDARLQKRDYDVNEPGVAHRIKKVRVQS